MNAKVDLASTRIESFSLYAKGHDVVLIPTVFESSLQSFGTSKSTKFAQSRATSLCATGKVYAMRIEKKVIEFADYVMTIIVRPKKPPAASNDNDRYDFWNDELKELDDRYDK